MDEIGNGPECFVRGFHPPLFSVLLTPAFLVVPLNFYSPPIISVPSIFLLIYPCNIHVVRYPYPCSQPPMYASYWKSPEGRRVLRYFYRRVWWFLPLLYPPIKEHFGFKNPPIKEHFGFKDSPIKELFSFSFQTHTLRKMFKKWPIGKNFVANNELFMYYFGKMVPQEHLGLIKSFNEHLFIKNKPVKEHFVLKAHPLRNLWSSKSHPSFISIPDSPNIRYPPGEPIFTFCKKRWTCIENLVHMSSKSIFWPETPSWLGELHTFWGIVFSSLIQENIYFYTVN